MGSAAWRLARQPPPPARPARPGSTARLPGSGQGQPRARDLAHSPPVCRPTLARRWALSWATLAEPAGEPLAPPPPDEAAPLRGDLSRWCVEIGLEFGCGDGSTGRSSGRPDGDVVRDAALTGPRLLRPPARGAARSRVRRLRGGGLPSVLRPDHGRTLSAAGPLLPHAHGRVLRGDRQRAWDRVAVLGLALVTRVSAAGNPRSGSGPFLAVEDAGPLAA